MSLNFSAFQQPTRTRESNLDFSAFGAETAKKTEKPKSSFPSISLNTFGSTQTSTPAFIGGDTLPVRVGNVVSAVLPGLRVGVGKLTGEDTSSFKQELSQRKSNIKELPQNITSSDPEKRKLAFETAGNIAIGASSPLGSNAKWINAIAKESKDASKIAGYLRQMGAKDEELISVLSKGLTQVDDPKMVSQITSGTFTKILPKISEPKPAYQGETDLTVKTLEKLKGRSTVSKQFISDLTNSPDLKHPERDLIRRVLDDMSPSDPLLSEARKYKSAEEFVRAIEEKSAVGSGFAPEMSGLNSEARLGDLPHGASKKPLPAGETGIPVTPSRDASTYSATNRYSKLYHGTDKEIKSINKINPQNGEAFYLTEEGGKKASAIASRRGVLQEIFVDESRVKTFNPQNPTTEINNIIQDAIDKIHGKGRFRYDPGAVVAGRDVINRVDDTLQAEVIRRASKLGYNDFRFYEPSTQEWSRAITDSTILKTKSQLTDIYNKAKSITNPVKYQSNVDRGIKVDDSNIELLNKNIFSIDHGYPVAMIDGKKRYLHSLIMEGQREKGFVIDHINGNKLDNRVENLRVISQKGNTSNRVLSKANTSGVTGVKWDGRINKWIASIAPDGKTIHLGSYSEIGDAIKARKQGEVKYFEPLWKRANEGVKAELPLSKVPQTVSKKQAKVPTINSIKELGKKVDELGGKTKEEIKEQIGELEQQLYQVSENIDEMPGKRLQKFISRKEGQFLDFKDPNKVKNASERLVIEERNKKIMREAESAFEGTSKSDMFDDPDTIREAIEEYQSTRALVNDLKSKVTNLRKESAALTKAQVASSVGMRQRRNQYRVIQDRWTLTDNEMKNFVHGRNLSAMSDSEWRNFVAEANKFGEQTEIQREAMIQLKGTIEGKELKKFDNLREALNLPPIHQMNTEQLINLEKILDQYKTGDEFLPVRMMQSIDNTELKGVRTVREVLEVLSKKSGRAVEDMPIKPTEWHRMLGDRRLAKQHPFLEVLVERKNRSLMEAEARVIELSDEVDGLIKKARASRRQTFASKAVPTDDNIVHWLEADASGKSDLAKGMTKEELAAAQRMDEIFKSYYDYLVKRHAEKKFSRFEGQYFPHVRRGFLEAWKDDGVLAAFKEFKNKFQQDSFTMNILNEQTQEILPYEKWVGFSQFRTDKLIPTSNAARAFDAYVTALEKAKHLDEMVPEIMAYVHSLSPRNFSQRGIELDTSLKKFVKEYINVNKGRVPKGFFNPGGTADVVNRSLITLTRILDLAFNFTTQLAAPIGENLMTLTMLKPQGYKTAVARSLTKQGKAILNKYTEFVGRTPWDTATRAMSDIGDKLMSGAFAIYAQSSRQANKLFLLGKMTEEEFKAGAISPERLAKLQIEMSKYRSIKGLESILGRTTEATAVKQYKSWAIPIFTATVENAGALAKLVRTEGVAKALSSDAGKELFYSIGIGSALGLVTYAKYKELSERGGKRNFVEDMAFKAMRDAVSIFGAFDPTMWSGVRVADFLEDLSKATLDLVMLEEYKTTGELKAPKEFKRAITPSLLRRLDTQKDTKSLQGLPKLPSMSQKPPTLPKLPKLPKLSK